MGRKQGRGLEWETCATLQRDQPCTDVTPQVPGRCNVAQAKLGQLRGQGRAWGGQEGVGGHAIGDPRGRQVGSGRKN